MLNTADKRYVFSALRVYFLTVTTIFELWTFAIILYDPHRALKSYGFVALYAEIITMILWFGYWTIPHSLGKYKHVIVAYSLTTIAILALMRHSEYQLFALVRLCGLVLALYNEIIIAKLFFFVSP